MNYLYDSSSAILDKTKDVLISFKNSVDFSPENLIMATTNETKPERDPDDDDNKSIADGMTDEELAQALADKWILTSDGSRPEVTPEILASIKESREAQKESE